MQKAVSGFSLTGILNNNGFIQNVCHKMFATNGLSQMSASLPTVLSITKIAGNAQHGKLQNC
ncbi:hypothetical protein [Dyadobacter alkalitolerans]|uniref:hypothetical protein n=1 Tax=Dyadobacter alkalitolerans TaxID=492736 RepID=UPI0012F9F4F2|nr:hypothetical protein [Dyadobacter alkalitolerans]